eukprot:7399739-Ditylum_brightwellii.AAC.1
MLQGIAKTCWEKKLIQSSQHLHVASSTDLSSHKECTSIADTDGLIPEMEACQNIPILKFASQTNQQHISPEETSAFADSLKGGRNVSSDIINIQSTKSYDNQLVYNSMQNNTPSGVDKVHVEEQKKTTIMIGNDVMYNSSSYPDSSTSQH